MARGHVRRHRGQRADPGLRRGQAGRQDRDRRGQNVYQIDGRGRLEINNLLPADQVSRIDKLQNGNTLIRPISPVSPDDAVITVVRGEEFGFLTLKDGHFASLRRFNFGPLIPIGLAGLGAQNVWRDAETLVVPAIARTPQWPGGGGGVYQPGHRRS